MERNRFQNGREALCDMDRQAQRIRDNIHNLNNSISRMQTDIEQYHRDEIQTYLMLAEVRLELLDDPEVVDKISVAEQEISLALVSRLESRAISDLKLGENENEQNILEKQRQDIVTFTEKLHIQVKESEKASLAKLLANKTYLDILHRIDIKQQQIQNTESKMEVARADYQEKSKPYYNDDLFVYLKERNYGHNDYRASGLINMLDGWIARFIGYENARRNYYMLFSIPGKLIQHKQLLNNQIEAIEKEKSDYKRNFYKKDNTSIIQEDYMRHKAILSEIDKKLELKTIEYKKILRLQTDETDEVYKRYESAINSLNNIYKSKSLENLIRITALSASPEDDALINELSKIKDSREKQQSIILTHQQNLEQEIKQLERLEYVRSGYKDHGYDRRGTLFRDGNDFANLLGGFLVGVLSNKQLWRAVGNTIEDVMDEIDLD